MSISELTTLQWSAGKPNSPIEGDAFYDETSERVMVYYSGTWFEMMSSDVSDRLKTMENREIALNNILEKDAD